MTLPARWFQPKNLAIAIGALFTVGPLIGATFVAHYRLGVMEVQYAQVQVELSTTRAAISRIDAYMLRQDERDRNINERLDEIRVSLNRIYDGGFWLQSRPDN